MLDAFQLDFIRIQRDLARKLSRGYSIANSVWSNSFGKC